MKTFNESIDQIFASKKVMIIGDLVADQYLNGTIARVSREAPVFILRHDETTTMPGSAANAAANVASLGGTPIVIGVTGNDVNGKLLLGSLTHNRVPISDIISDDSFSTTTKLRVLAGQPHAVHQQVIRIDYENQAGISDAVRHQLIENISVCAQGADAIIVSDYDYGVADTTVFDTALKIATSRDIPIIVDSRFRLREFPGATAATPNQEEVEQILGKDFTSSQVQRLCIELGYHALLVTNGNKGMQLFEPDKDVLQIDAVGPLDPVDVTGAGDTVIAAFALGLASGLSFAESARIANHAGGLVVMKKGTASVSASELLTSLETASKAAVSNPHV